MTTLRIYREKLEKGIIRSAESWAGVRRVSLDAYDAIVKAKNITDEVMITLPTGEATDEIINKLIKQMDPRLVMKVKIHEGKKQPSMLKHNHRNKL
jgi:hypothetical protein